MVRTFGKSFSWFVASRFFCWIHSICSFVLKGSQNQYNGEASSINFSSKKKKNKIEQKIVEIRKAAGLFFDFFFFFTPDLNMLGCWPGVRAKERCLFKYTKNLFRFDRRSHILRGSGGLLITFLWQKNVITTTATYSVYLSRQKQSCLLSLSRKSFILISIFCVPAATSQRWGRHTKMPSWKNTTSSWASCPRLWWLLPTLWLTNLLSMGVQIQADHSMRVDALTLPYYSLQGCLDNLKMILYFACLLPNLKPNTNLFTAFRRPWPF